MTDRELLELAAKAAGYDVRWHDAWECFVHVDPFNTNNPPTMAGQRMVWVPLDDDGDALRLAMQLDIDVQFNTDDDEQTTSAIAPSPEQPGSGEGWSFTESWRGDKYAATRRAIVRAAAEIGRTMP